MAPRYLGVTIDVRKAFERYAKMLPPGKWNGLMVAFRWFRAGSRLQRFWRHTVYRRLRPCRYEERRLQCEEAEQQTKQALIAAIFDRFGKAPFQRQNWRYN